MHEILLEFARWRNYYPNENLGGKTPANFIKAKLEEKREKGVKEDIIQREKTIVDRQLYKVQSQFMQLVFEECVKGEQEKTGDECLRQVRENMHVVQMEMAK